jgi:hypothetical protein
MTLWCSGGMYGTFDYARRHPINHKLFSALFLPIRIEISKRMAGSDVCSNEAKPDKIPGSIALLD